MKRKKYERNDVISNNVVLDRVVQYKPKARTDHQSIRESAVIPYDTGKVKIGVYYQTKVNYYNSDQDWVQKALLGIETSWTTDTVLISAMYALALYAVLGLLTRG